jgi:hypothetical protein
VLLAGAVWGWWRWMNVVPVIPIPAVELPSPNGFDYYVAAAGRIVELDAVRHALQPDSGVSSAERAELLRKNAPALRMLREGFQYECRVLPVRSWGSQGHDRFGLRQLAPLLRLEAQARAAAGDTAGAMESCLDGLRLGQDILRGADFDGSLTSAHVQTLIWYSAWGLDDPDALRARDAARRLEAILERQVPFADALREEKRTGLVSLQELLRLSRWRDEFESNPNLGAVAGTALLGMLGRVPKDERPDWNETWERARLHAHMYLFSSSRVFQVYGTRMDALIEAGSTAWPSRPPVPAPSDCPVNQALPVDVDRIRCQLLETQARNALLLVTLALRAYRLERGGYPETLAELAPSYLRKLPADPFGAGQGFGYRREGGRYVLYSVGPDGKDDGGEPLVNPGSVPNSISYHRVELDSVGDLVPGVNGR